MSIESAASHRTDKLLENDVKEPLEEESQFIEENVLTRKEAGECLSHLGKVGNGLEFAYLYLNVSDKRLTNIYAVISFKHVMYVNVSGNFLKTEDLLCLSNLKYLLAILADRNLIENAELPPMTYLQVLTFNKNKINSTLGINHPVLECLELKNNQIQEVAGLNPYVLQNLKILDLRSNFLTSTKGIYLPSLKKLYIAGNYINELSGLGTLVNLKILHVRDNDLSDLNGFSLKMKNLEYINVRNNRIANVAEFKKLAVLPNLKVVVVLDNPFALEDEEGNYRIQILSYILKLNRIDKLTVNETDREEALELLQNTEFGEEGEDEEYDPKDNDDSGDD